MKIILLVLGLILSTRIHAEIKTDTIKFIGVRNGGSVGSQTHLYSFKIIKVLQGNFTGENIKVSFLEESYQTFSRDFDTILVTLIATKDGDHVHWEFPLGKTQLGLEKVKVSYIDFDYWAGCETGEGACNPLTLKRDTLTTNWYLILPCGGTFTTVTLSKQKGWAPAENEIIQKSEVSHSECPPVFDLTDLADGKYYLYMLACGLGGPVEINVVTTQNK